MSIMGVVQFKDVGIYDYPGFAGADLLSAHARTKRLRLNEYISRSLIVFIDEHEGDEGKGVADIQAFMNMLSQQDPRSLEFRPLSPGKETPIIFPDDGPFPEDLERYFEASGADLRQMITFCVQRYLSNSISTGIPEMHQAGATASIPRNVPLNGGSYGTGTRGKHL